MSKELEQKLDAALDAIDQQRVEIDELKAKVDKFEQSVNSLDIKSLPAVRRALKNPGTVEVKDADGKKLKVSFATLAFRVPTPSGIVKYIAEDVANDPKKVQELYEQHPSLFVKAD